MNKKRFTLVAVFFLLAVEIFAQCTANFTYSIQCKTVTFTDASTPVGNIETWNWSFTGGTPSSFNGQNPPPINYATIGTKSVSLTIITNGGNCTHTSTQQVVIQPQPTASFMWALSNCPNQVTFNGTVTNSTIFEWNFGFGPPNNTTLNPVVTFPTPGIKTVTLTAFSTDANCEITATQTITIYPNLEPDFTITQNTPHCSFDPVIFTSTTTGGSANNTYSWNFNPGTATGPGPHSHVFNAYGNGNQTYNVTLTVTNPDNGCTASVTKPVTVTQRPDASLTEINLILPNTISNCINATPNNPDFTIYVTYSPSVPTTNSSYKIIWGDGTIPDWTSLTPPVNLVHTYYGLEIYDLEFTVFKANGCNDTKIYHVINIGNPSLSFGNPGGSAGCAPLNLTFPISGFENNHPLTTYTICFGDGTPCITYPHPPPTSVTHIYTTSSCPFPPGEFYPTCTATNPCKSTTITAGSVEVYTPPNPLFQPNNLNGCLGVPITFYNSTLPAWGPGCNNQVLMKWDFGDGTVQGPALYGYPYPNATHTYNSPSLPGNYTVTLTMWNYCAPGSGPGVTYQFNVCIEAQGGANFSVVPTIPPATDCIPKVVNVHNISDDNQFCDNNTYTWSVPFYDNGDCQSSTNNWAFSNGNANSVEPQFTFFNPGTYTIQMRLDNACVTNSIHDEVVVVKGPPVLTGLNGIMDGCQPVSINPTVTLQDCYGTVPANGFDWDFPGGSPVNGNTLNPGPIVYSSAGTYNITVTASNECGASNQLFDNLVVSLGIENNTITGPAVNPICQGDIPGIIIGTVPPELTGGNGFYTYVWEMDDNIGFTSPSTVGTNPDLNYGSQLFQTTWFRRIVNSGGCSDTSNVCEITVIPGIINNTISANQSICVGQTPAVLTGTPPQGGTEVYSYLWQQNTVPPTNWGEADNTNPIDLINYQPPALNVSTMYRRIVNSVPPDECDSESLPVTITVNPAPTLTSATQKFICSGNPVSYYPTANIPGTTFNWTAVNNAPGCISGVVPTSGTGTITHTLVNTCNTIETVSYSITPIGPPPSNCPGEPVVLVVEVNPQITIDLSALQNPIGSGMWTDITATINGGTPPYNIINWTGGGIAAGQGTNTITTVPLFINTGYNISITDSKGCSASASIVITIGSNPPLLTAIANPTPICIGDQSTLTATATGGSGNFEYQWYDDLGNEIGLPGENPVTVNPVVTTTYTVTANDGFNPVLNGLVTVVVNPTPYITSPLVWEICNQTSVGYTPESEDVPGTTFTWISNNTVPECLTEIGGDWIGDIETLIINSCLTPQTITYTITPTGPPLTFCPGVAENLIVTVNPTAHIINTPSGQTIISGGCPVDVPLNDNNSDVSPVFYEWSTPGNPNLSDPYDGPVSDNGDLTFSCSINVSGANETELLVFTIVPVYQGETKNCPGTPFTHTVTINQVPTVFNISVNGDGTFCEDDPDCVDIAISGTEVGIHYQLMIGFNPYPVAVVVGDGNPYTWQTICQAGTYSVLATNPNSGASIFMNGSIVVQPLPLPDVYLLVPFGDQCAPVFPKLNGSQAGVEYILYKQGNILPVATVDGTGLFGFLDFGVTLTEEGTYYARARISYPNGLVCWNDMENVLIVHPLPKEFDILPLGILCEGQVEITLEGSQDGFEYQLWFNNEPFGPIVYGTGGPISFGIINQPGEFRVRAKDPVWGCEIFFEETIFIFENPLIFQVIPAEGCPGTEIILSGWQPGVDYYLWFIPATDKDIQVIGPVQGIPGEITINFGPFFDEGEYYVKAISPELCESMMEGSTFIRSKPIIYNIEPQGGGCTPQIIALDDCEEDVIYYLYVNNVLIAWDDCTDGEVNFGQQSNQGIYTVRAKKVHSSGLECWEDMNGSYEIYPLPLIYNLNPAGTFCPPVELLLSGSQLDFIYNLYNIPNGIVNTVIGTGGIISFGQQSAEGDYYVVAVDPVNQCEQTMNGTTTILPQPFIYDVQPQSNECIPTEITLSGSQIDVLYQLYLDGTIPIGPPIIGTGNMISFGLQSLTGTYTVYAYTSTIPSCWAWMNGSTTINPLTVYTISPQGIHCPDVEIFLNGSQVGVNYKLYFNNAPTSTVIAGTGAPISFGYWDTPGVYRIVAIYGVLLCSLDMAGSLEIVPSPLVFDISPQGQYCPSQTIELDDCEDGAVYYLYRGTILVATDDCTDGVVSFAPQSYPGIYTVKAKITYGGIECWSDMNGIYEIYPLPIQFTLSPAGEHCPPVDLVLNGSETGVNYHLYHNNIQLLSIPGTGAILPLGSFSEVGEYFVVAENGYMCSDTMYNTAIILPEPELFEIQPQDNQCDAIEISLSDSQVGIFYQLYLNGTIPIGAPIVGDGASISFGLQSLTGTYTVYAYTNTVPSCWAWMNGSTTINPLTVYTISPQGIHCPDVEIFLNGSQVGVNYKLYFNNAPTSTVIAGTGAPISFGYWDTPGVYRIVAIYGVLLCSLDMAGSLEIVPSPLVFDISPQGQYCPSQTIELDDCEDGAVYYLYRGTILVATDDCTDGVVSFAPQSYPGIYTVKAKITYGGIDCWSNMNGALEILPVPLVYSLVPSGALCSPVELKLSGSQVGVTYNLFNIPNGLMMTVVGDGNIISFGTQTAEGDYYVEAVNTNGNNCMNTMQGVTTIHPEPLVFNVQPPTIECDETDITLSGSQLGVFYQLYRNGFIPVGNPVPGTGAVLPMGTHSLGGTYTVTAYTGTTPPCSAEMDQSTIILPLTTYSINPAGYHCPGVNIYLNGSQVGVDYELFVGGLSTGTVIPGTGGVLDFGMQNLPGTYTIIGYDEDLECDAQMGGICIIEAAPIIFPLNPEIGGGCPGQTISLANCEPDVIYHLYRGLNSVATSVCNGGVVSFPVQTIPGIYTIKAQLTHPSGLTCWSEMSGHFTIYPIPIVYQLTPTGNNCAPVNFQLNGSEVGVKYQLYMELDLPIGTPIDGTGNVLNFPTQSSSGNYYVIATNGNGVGDECPWQMSGITTILPAPEIFTIAPLGVVCSETLIQLSLSQVGVNYQLRWNGSTNIGAQVAGTGTTISFGTHSLPGTYTILASTGTNPECTALMNGSTIIEPLTSYSIIPQGVNCPPAHIRLNGSTVGVEYELLLGGSAISPNPVKVIGTGGIISFGNHTMEGIYTVRASTTAPDCFAMMTGSCILQQGPTPIPITPAGLSCTDDNVSVGLGPNSEVGETYYLYYNGTYMPPPLPGTGGPIDFGVQTLPGTYTIKAIVDGSLCAAWMPDTVVLASPPVVYNIVPQGLLCAETEIKLNGSQPGIEYTLKKNNIDLISTIPGTGIAISFGVISDPGTYTIIAYDPNTECDSDMNGEVTITPGPFVYNFVAPDPVNGSSYCEGDDGVTLQLSQSQNGVEYQLWKVVPPEMVGLPKIGTGGPLEWDYILAGSYYVKATYPNDPNCTAVMNNVVTVIEQPMPTAYAGADAVMCESESYQIVDASITNWSGIQWDVITGSGGFDNVNAEQPIFTPNDVNAITNMILRVKAFGINPPCSNNSFVEDFITITVEPKPEVEAGNSVVICETDAYQILDAFVNFGAGFIWTLSPNIGSLDNTGIIQPTYTPPDVNISTDVTLTLTATGQGECNGEIITDFMTITIEPKPEVEAGNSVVICETETYQILDAFVNFGAGFTWTLSPNIGSLDNTGIIQPTYTPPDVNISTDVTLTLTATGQGECNGEIITDFMTITIEPKPEVEAGNSVVICETETYQILDAFVNFGAGFTWTLSPNIGSLNNTGIIHPTYTPPDVNISTDVTLTLTATGQGECAGEIITDFMTITIEPKPEVEAGNSVVICETETYQILDAFVNFGAGFTWTLSPNIGSLDNTGIIQPTYTPPDVNISTDVTLTLTATGQGECNGEIITDFMTITIEPKPEVEAGNSVVICETETYQITTAAVDFATSFYWTIDPNIGNLDNPFVINPTYISPDVNAVTDVTLTLTANGQGACDDEIISDFMTITIAPQPEVFAGYDISMCDNVPYYISDAMVNFADSVRWKIIMGNGTLDNDTITHPTYTPAIPEEQVVKLQLIGYGSGACSNDSITDFLDIYIYQSPVANFDYTDISCITGHVKFDDISSSSWPKVAWKWYFGDGDYAYEKSPEHVYDISVINCFDVTLIVIDAKGCSDTITQQVCIEPELAVHIEAENECLGTPVQFSGLVDAGGPALSWQWFFGDGQQAWGQNVPHDYPAPGNYLATLKVHYGDTCHAYAYKVITVYSLPEPNFTWEDPTAIYNVKFNGTAITSGIITDWQWTFDGNLWLINEQNPTWPCNGHGTYIVTLKVTDSNGCVGEITKTVVIPPYLQASFVVDDVPMCSDHIITFTDNSYDPTKIYSWEWTFELGGQPEFYYNYQPTYSHKYSAAGDFEVCLKVTMNTPGGTSDDTYCQTVTILPSPEADFKWDSICIGENTQFTDQTVFGMIPIKYWDWKFGVGSAGSTTQNPEYQYPVAEFYPVRLIVESNAGCRDTIEKQVRIHALPEVGISWENPCVTQNTVFTDTSQADGSVIEKWNWVITNGSNQYESSDANPVFSFNTTGNYTANLTVTDANGCVNSGSFTVPVYSIPLSQFSFIENYNGVQGQVKFVNESVNGVNYLWDFSDPPASTEKNPVHSFYNDDTYTITLIVENSDSCRDTSTKTYVMVYAGLFIPNAFSPEDPNPDIRLFKPAGYGLVEYQIEVFDIWGTMLWSSTKLDANDGSPTEGWDGTYKGQKLPTGVYVWKAMGVFSNGKIWKGSDIGDGKKPQTQGSVLLIR
jgi:PKD repeat protein